MESSVQPVPGLKIKYNGGMSISSLVLVLFGIVVCVAVFWITWKVVWKDSDDDPHVK